MRQTTLFRRRTLFDEALAVIEEEYADQGLTLTGVSRSIATSRRQLQRVFGDHHTSFRAELQRVRMTKAAALLRAGRVPISAVAESVGYRQPAQFSKAFRRHHGCPPSELRRMPERMAA